MKIDTSTTALIMDAQKLKAMLSEQVVRINIAIKLLNEEKITLNEFRKIVVNIDEILSQINLDKWKT